MPTTMQKKRRYLKHHTDCCDDEKERSESKLLSRIPAALVLLFLVFLWSSSTTFLSGSVFHVCVASRKLNNHLYCISSGTTSHNNYSVLGNAQASPAASISAVFRSPLSALSLSAKESAAPTKNVKAPSTVAIPLPSDGPPEEAKDNTTGNQTKTTSQIEEEIEIGKKDAEEQMQVLRLYKNGKPLNYSYPKACEGRGIFVYDLPAKFNKDLLGHCTSVAWLDFCKFLLNNAFGTPVLQLGDGWYNTHQYALEPIFHARVLKHRCRVDNPDEARLFYVPYYGGLDILRWHFKKNISIQVKDKLSYELIGWLSQQPPWKKSLGADHLFVLGKISWDFRRMKNFTWGTHFLDLDEMQSPMKLLIERHPWHINDVGVPHPSFFHPRSDEDIVAWQQKLMQMPRNKLVSFAGAPRPKARQSIRSILIQQCTSAPDKCHFLDCREARCTQPAPMVQLFTESEFCLQPAGDSPTRKSVFDSLVSGCIPVLFNPFTAYYQYPWHLPAHRSNYSVFVDEDAVKRHQVNVIDRLAAIPPSRRMEMRSYIVYHLLPGLLYAHPEAKLHKFADAFDVAINSVLNRMGRLP